MSKRSAETKQSSLSTVEKDIALPGVPVSFETRPHAELAGSQLGETILSRLSELQRQHFLPSGNARDEIEATMQHISDAAVVVSYLASAVQKHPEDFFESREPSQYRSKFIFELFPVIALSTFLLSPYREENTKMTRELSRKALFALHPGYAEWAIAVEALTSTGGTRMPSLTFLREHSPEIGALTAELLLRGYEQSDQVVFSEDEFEVLLTLVAIHRKGFGHQFCKSILEDVETPRPLRNLVHRALSTAKTTPVGSGTRIITPEFVARLGTGTEELSGNRPPITEVLGARISEAKVQKEFQEIDAVILTLTQLFGTDEDAATVAFGTLSQHDSTLAYLVGPLVAENLDEQTQNKIQHLRSSLARNKLL